MITEPRASLPVVVILLAACGSPATPARVVQGIGDPVDPPTVSQFTLGGTAKGIKGLLTLASPVGGPLQSWAMVQISADGAFAFPGTFPSGSSYDVTVVASSPVLTCTVTNGVGVFSGNVTNVLVDCTINPTWIQEGVIEVDLAMGEKHSCAIVQGDLCSQRSVYCWGKNDDGQLGLGSSGPGTEVNVPMPVALPGIPREIALGSNHTCAIASDAGGGADRLYCWGANGSGQIGAGGTTSVALPFAITLPNGDVPIAISLGDLHTCAIGQGSGSERSLYCWGDNRYGQLGLGNFSNAPLHDTPQLVTAVSAPAAIGLGWQHTCAIFQPTGGNELYCWGQGQGGQLGVGWLADESSPQPVANLVAAPQAVSAGLHHTCAVLGAKHDALACWGWDQDGQLGIGGPPNQIHAMPQPVVVALPPGSTSQSAVSAGARHTCATIGAATGNLHCWGANPAGQLGVGPGVPSTSVPTQLWIGSATHQVASGGGHTCKFTTLATGVKVVSCWGDNSHGQLGTADWQSRDIPTKIMFPVAPEPDQMFLLGGQQDIGGQPVYYNDVYRSTDGLNWSQVTSNASWFPRKELTGAFLNDQLWIMGGLDTDGYAGANDLWTSQDGGGLWSALPSKHYMNMQDRSALIEFQHKLFIVSGAAWVPQSQGVWSSSDGTSWSQLSNPPWSGKQGFFGLTSFAGQLWIVGGYDFLNTWTNKVYSSPDGVTWTLMAPPPWAARLEAEVVAFHNELWVIGGHGCPGLFDSCTDIWSSPDGMAWTYRGQVPWAPTLSEFRATVFQGKLIVTGGGEPPATYHNDTWWTSDGISWINDTSPQPWTPRAGHATIVSEGCRPDNW